MDDPNPRTLVEAVTVPKRHLRSNSALWALATAALLILSTPDAMAQAPPAPPPTPDASDSADEQAAPPAPERPDEQSDEEEASDSAVDGEPPPPPDPGVLEYGERDSGDPGGAKQEQKANAPASPAETYDARFLRIARTQGDPIAHQFRYGTSTTAVRGTFGSLVDPPEFYQKVGRPDLAEKFERRSTSRVVFMGSMTLLGTVGTYAFALAGAATVCAPPCTEEERARRDRKQAIYNGLAAGSFFGGLAGFISTLFWSAHPVGLEERRALADRHNAELKNELGLPSDYSAARSRPPVRLRIGGAPTEGGAIGVLRVDF